jgi:hypothetical protein
MEQHTNPFPLDKEEDFRFDALLIAEAWMAQEGGNCKKEANCCECDAARRIILEVSGFDWDKDFEE